jgi:hypothetical protein
MSQGLRNESIGVRLRGAGAKHANERTLIGSSPDQTQTHDQGRPYERQREEHDAERLHGGDFSRAE